MLEGHSATSGKLQEVAADRATIIRLNLAKLGYVEDEDKIPFPCCCLTSSA
jgi:hypothetical protein